MFKVQKLKKNSVQTITEKNILDFSEEQNEITKAAIEEERRIFDDQNVKGCKTMADLKAALEE